MGHKIGKEGIGRQLFRPPRVIETINKYHVDRRQRMAGDQAVQHVGKAVFIPVGFAIKQHQRPARGLRQARAVIITSRVLCKKSLRS